MYKILLILIIFTLNSVILAIKKVGKAKHHLENVLLEDNIFGFCKEKDDPIQYVKYVDPYPYEISEFQSLPRTKSRVNIELAQGIVKGVSTINMQLKQKGTQWTVPRGHPRKNVTFCLETARLSTKEYQVSHDYDTSQLYDKYKDISQLDRFYYFNIEASAIIHPTGMVMISCGYIQLLDGCETRFSFMGRKWWRGCRKLISKAQLFNYKNLQSQGFIPQCFDAYGLSNIPSTEMEERKHINDTNLMRYKRVITMAANWDHNYHHIMVDSLARIVRLLPFLRKNPDVYIHIRRFEMFVPPENRASGEQIRNRVFDLLGIDTKRLIWGPVLADQVILPAAMPCNQVMLRPLEQRLLAKELIERAKVVTSTSTSTTASTKNKKPNKMVIIQRWIPDDNETMVEEYRDWPDSVYEAVIDVFTKKFPELELVRMSNKPQTATNNNNSSGSSLGNTLSLADHIMIYQDTALLVGAHGAGLHNMIFLPPGAMVVEIAAKYDARILPVCGYHGPLATIFGVHHFVHYYDTKIRLDPPVLMDYPRVASEAREFYDEIRNKINQNK